MVEYALLSKLPSFDLYLGLYDLPDSIAQGIVSELHIKLF